MNTPDQHPTASSPQPGDTRLPTARALASLARAKIFIATHKSASFVSDNDGVYQPLQVGRAVMLERSKDREQSAACNLNSCLTICGDDTGDNISHLNRYLNELTGHYWVWKNFDLRSVEFIGFCHYRRYFLFDQAGQRPTTRWLPCSDYYVFDFIDPDVAHLASATRLNDLLSMSDLIAPKKYDTRHLDPSVTSCRSRFIVMGHCGSLYDAMFAEVATRHPSFNIELAELSRSALHYHGNMFVMRSQDFQEYCDFIFPVLFGLTKRIQDETNPHKQRAPAHLAEFLTSMYLSHMQRTRTDLRCHEVDVAYVLISEPSLTSRQAMSLMSTLAIQLVTWNCLAFVTCGFAGKQGLSDLAVRFDEFGTCVKRPLVYRCVAFARRAFRFLSRRLSRIRTRPTKSPE